MQLAKTFLLSLSKGAFRVGVVLGGAAIVACVVALAGWILPPGPVEDVVSMFKVTNIELSGVGLLFVRGMAWWFYAAALVAAVLGLAFIGGFGKAEDARC